MYSTPITGPQVGRRRKEIAELVGWDEKSGEAYRLTYVQVLAAIALDLGLSAGLPTGR